MENRARALSHTASVITAAGSVEVIGVHGSGKTHFITQVVEHFRNLTWHVVEVRGLYAYRNTPFASLALAGLNSVAQGRPGSPRVVVSELEEMLAAPHSLLVLEDAEFIDDASWGALSAVCSSNHTPTLLSRLPGSSRNRIGNQLEGMSIAPGFGVHLGPLGFDDLSAALTQATGTPLHSSAMSHVFASSGGNVGLAITMVRAAIHEDRLSLEHGRWTTSDSFWSSALIPYIDALLAELSDEQWDALEILSLLGVVDIDTLMEFTGPEVPTQLEELSLIGFYPSAGRLLVTVQPPLLVDFFRHRPAAARRHRLSALLEAHVRAGAETSVQFRLPAMSQSPDAPFVRLVHEHLRNRLLVAQTEWSRSPSRETLANLIEISVASGATAEELEALFADVAALSDHESEQMLVRWEFLRADHWLFITGEFQRAIDSLRAAAGRFPRLGALFGVRIFEIERVVFPTADPSLLPDPHDPTLDARVRAATHMAIGSELLRGGRVIEAKAHYDGANALEPFTGAVDRMGFVIVSDYFAGHCERARRAAEQGLAEAKDSFDNVAIRGYCYLLALLDLHDGRVRRAEESIRLAFSLGEPIRQPPFVHLSFLVMGAVIAVGQGNLDAARALQAQYEHSAVPDSLLPGGSRSWATARVIAAEQNPVAGADHAEQGGTELWERGAHLNAALAYLTALEYDLSEERLERLRPRLADIDSPYVADRVRCLTAVLREELTTMERCAAEFAELGQLSDALGVYRECIRVAKQRDDVEAVERNELRLRHLRESLPPGEYGERRVRSGGVQFSAREIQIAGLAISGKSNQAIADALVLSVRTVESHMHRIMKKAQVERRQDLAFVEELAGARGPRLG